jgi:hypothetical protein
MSPHCVRFTISELLDGRHKICRSRGRRVHLEEVQRILVFSRSRAFKMRKDTSSYSGGDHSFRRSGSDPPPALWLG